MKTAIVEIRESHEECIYSQLRFLKDAGHQVTLILHPVLARQIKEYAHLADETRYFDFEARGVFQKLRLQWRVYGILKKFDLIVLNTAHSYSVLRNLTVLLQRSKVQCVGILHDISKLDRSSTQRIISRKVKKYFVLNDVLLPSKNAPIPVKIQSFYPVFFPNFEPVPLYKQNAIWIAIPGRIDYERRDYDYLIKALEGISKLDRVKFLILGKLDRNRPTGKKLYDHIEKSGQLGRFKIFQEFVPNPDFHAYLKNCDFVMPLLKTSESYLKYKISGAINLAFAYKKPLLCNQFFKANSDLKANAHFFDNTSLAALIKEIDSGSIENPAKYSDPKWDYSFQQRRYIDFINE